MHDIVLTKAERAQIIQWLRSARPRRQTVTPKQHAVNLRFRGLMQRMRRFS